jgi:hypothetical protein
LNTECIVVVQSDKISKGVLIGMEKEFSPENSWETTAHFNPDSEVKNIKRLKTWTRKSIGRINTPSHLPIYNKKQAIGSRQVIINPLAVQLLSINQ